MESYAEFLGGVILFRATRDMDRFPETWMERQVSSIKSQDWSQDERDHLILMTKVAELVDDRKADLLEEIEEGINRINEVLRQQQGLQAA